MSAGQSCETLRAKMLEFCSSSCLTGPGFAVDTVSFQPLQGKDNEDRVVSHFWDVCGYTWLLLAVFDGHGGSITSDYAANHLPSRIRSSLSEMLGKELLGRVEKGAALSKRVSRMLQKEIKTFDDSIGRVVKGLFPNLRSMPEEEIKNVVEANQDVLIRAHQGSTMAGVLVNLELKDAWTFNLGDSSVVISHTNENTSRSLPYYDALTTQHLAYKPKEYCLQTLRHPSKEGFIEDGYIFGLSELTRALGDHHYKLPAKYIRHVFSHLPPRVRFDYSGTRIKTPPYILNLADVGYVDFAQYTDVKLFLFTDGVDDIVQWLHRSPKSPRKAKPGQIVAYLGSESARAVNSAGEQLGHAVQYRWNGTGGNRAVDILANLLGGTDAERLGRVLDPTLLRQLRDPDWDPTKHIYVDDTSLIVCELTS